MHLVGGSNEGLHMVDPEESNGETPAAQEYFGHIDSSHLHLQPSSAWLESCSCNHCSSTANIGLVERFDQTLKDMLCKATAIDGKDWDKLIPYLLFAYREVFQESTGFSPLNSCMAEM